MRSTLEGSLILCESVWAQTNGTGCRLRSAIRSNLPRPMDPRTDRLPQPEQGSDTLTIPEAARLLRVPKATVYKLAKLGTLPKRRKSAGTGGYAAATLTAYLRIRDSRLNPRPSSLRPSSQENRWYGMVVQRLQTATGWRFHLLAR
jgi:excisionase family DNA binding protein